MISIAQRTKRFWLVLAVTCVAATPAAWANDAAAWGRAMQGVNQWMQQQEARERRVEAAQQRQQAEAQRRQAQDAAQQSRAASIAANNVLISRFDGSSMSITLPADYQNNLPERPYGCQPIPFVSTHNGLAGRDF